MEPRKSRLPRPGPRCLAIALIALLIDACLLPPTATCSLQSPTRGPRHGLYYILTRSNGALHATQDPDAETVGWANVFMFHTPMPHFWAPLRQQWTVTFYFTMYDGSTPTPSEAALIGVDVANIRGLAAGLPRALLEIGGGASAESLPLGHLHNAAAFTTGLLALAAVPGTARALMRRRRISRGCCIHCAYHRKGLASATPCPECGRPRSD